MWKTSTPRLHDDCETVLSNVEAAMIRIRLLEQARPGKEADAQWERKLRQTGSQSSQASHASNSFFMEGELNSPCSCGVTPVSL